jgi:hypothetical protein
MYWVNDRGKIVPRLNGRGEKVELPTSASEPETIVGLAAAWCISEKNFDALTVTKSPTVQTQKKQMR